MQCPQEYPNTSYNILVLECDLYSSTMTPISNPFSALFKSYYIVAQPGFLLHSFALGNLIRTHNVSIGDLLYHYLFIGPVVLYWLPMPHTSHHGAGVPTRWSTHQLVFVNAEMLAQNDALHLQSIFYVQSLWL